MFKSRKKRQQKKAEAEALAAAEAAKTEQENSSTYKLLEDFKVTSDFRSSVILPQLNKDLDPIKLSRQQQHLAQLRDIPEAMSPPLSPPPIHEIDGTKQYQDLAAWRHQRSQNRYSNGLFGGKQRGRPKPNQIKRFAENDKGELEEVLEEETTNASTTDITVNSTKNTLSETITASTRKQSDNLEIKPSIQLKDMLKNESIPSEDEEEEEGFTEEAYEPDSDTEENFFFQDFSANGGNKQRRPRNNNTRRRRSTKVMSRFDLSSFAKDLHDHRLSVIQPRDSRIIMTEDDELELEKLLERQRQRMSVVTMNGSTESLKIVPPLPSLDLIKPHKSISTNAAVTQIITKKATAPPVQEENMKMPTMHSDHGSTTTNSLISEIHSAGSRSSQESYKGSNKIAAEDDVPQNITDTVQPTTITTIEPVASVSPSNIRQSNHEIQTDRLKRSVSTASIRSNKSNLSKPALQPIRDEQESSTIKRNARKSLSMDNIHISLDANEPSVTSAALDWIAEDGLNDKSNMNPIQQDTSKPLLYQQAPIKSRGLFGSLRQVSRSKTLHSGNGGVSSIKGLVRNFSSSNQHQRASLSTATSNRDSTGMSRAAMAVIQHNVAKHEKTKVTSVIPDEKQEKRRSDNQKQVEQDKSEKRQTRERAKSDANNSSGSRLISQLISRATSASRKKNNTKIVNMETDNAAKKRAQVVRRTIIYVQPDSLHDLLKNGGEGSVKMPPLPTNINTSRSTNQARSTVVSDGSLSPDDETIRSREYVTATKVSRQTSVRKRVVDVDTDANQGSPLRDVTNQDSSEKLTRNGSRRRWQLQSMDEDDMMPRSQRTKKTPSSSSNEDNGYMEGVELREMSDGSVVWGIVKKQGNRKSFYAPNQKNEYEHVEDELDDDYFQQKVMKKSTLSPSPSISRTSGAAPPPIPRRSPRRQVSQDTSANYIASHSSNDSTTDIYYSDEVTLPSLLKMMQGDMPSEEEDLEDEYTFNEHAMSSVDDQLDEMMRILTSQQQQQQQRVQKIH